MAFNDKKPILQYVNQNSANVNAKPEHYDTGKKKKMTITYEGGKKVILHNLPIMHMPPTLPKPAQKARPVVNREGIRLLAGADGNANSQPRKIIQRKITFFKPDGKTIYVDTTSIAPNARVHPKPAFGYEMNITHKANTSSDGKDMPQNTTSTENKGSFIVLWFKKVDQEGEQSTKTIPEQPPSQAIHSLHTESPSTTAAAHPVVIQSSTSTTSTKSLPIATQVTTSLCLKPSSGSDNAMKHQEIVQALNDLTVAVNKLASRMEKEIKELKEQMKGMRHERYN